jgi:hypothetical protein
MAYFSYIVVVSFIGGGLIYDSFIYFIGGAAVVVIV